MRLAEPHVSAFPINIEPLGREVVGPCEIIAANHRANPDQEQAMAPTLKPLADRTILLTSPRDSLRPVV
jgi:hypothetical protein